MPSRKVLLACPIRSASWRSVQPSSAWRCRRSESVRRCRRRAHGASRTVDDATGRRRLRHRKHGHRAERCINFANLVVVGNEVGLIQELQLPQHLVEVVVLDRLLDQRRLILSKRFRWQAFDLALDLRVLLPRELLRKLIGIRNHPREVEQIELRHDDVGIVVLEGLHQQRRLALPRFFSETPVLGDPVRDGVGEQPDKDGDRRHDDRTLEEGSLAFLESQLAFLAEPSPPATSRVRSRRSPRALPLPSPCACAGEGETLWRLPQGSPDRSAGL